MEGKNNLCYTGIIEREGTSMARSIEEIRQKNRENVRDYKAKVKEIKVRLPLTFNDRDFVEVLKEKAAEKGFVNTKGNAKGEGNINAFIMDLIEKSLEE